MKRINFKNSVTVLAIGLAAVSCGGNANKEQLKGNALDNAAEKMVEQAAKGKEFTKAGGCVKSPF
ncbi:MAG: hypothetical protein LBL07_06945 [Tannerella sp.]|jgi:hypothetical protein|nr:hypothetical protein [Tannerella sp.]